MRRVRQKGTAAELRVGAALRNFGVAYRLNVQSLPGSPDFANKRRRWAIFVQGCFWHHHKGCRRATVPKANNRFWKDKFLANRLRDARAVRRLREQGFRVGLIWECQALDQKRLGDRLSKILESRRVDMGEPFDH